MANASESSVTLRPEVVERAAVLAAQQDCSVAELIAESVQWYADMDRLIAAIESGGDRSEPQEQVIQDYVNRVIHEYRAERRAETREKRQGELKAS
jgi:hypothetical protein